MLSAGRALIKFIKNLNEYDEFQQVLVLCGGGNNGGDGFALAGLLAASGKPTTIVLVPNSQQASDASKAAATFAKDQAVTFTPFTEFLNAKEHSDPALSTLYVDGIYGIGLNRTLDESSCKAIDKLNELRRAAQRSRVLAIDIPSGLDAKTGAAHGPIVHADYTLSFFAPKVGALTGAGPDHCGVQSICPLVDEKDTISHPQQHLQFPPSAHLVLGEDLNAIAGSIWRRKLSAHKGTHGTGLLVAGGPNMAGAAVLSGLGALHAGIGKLLISAHQNSEPTVSCSLPEAICHGIDSAAAFENVLGAHIKSLAAIAIGPGLSMSAWGQQIFQRLCALISSETDRERHQPIAIIIDACGLSLLANTTKAIRSKLSHRHTLVLTPHPKEAAHLLDKTVSCVQADRIGNAQELAEKFNALVVLKGVGSVVAVSKQTPLIIGAGSPALSVAGSGDVLTGLLLAILSQSSSLSLQQSGDKAELQHVVASAVILHALAGERLANTGRLIGARANEISQVVRELIHEYRLYA